MIKIGICDDDAYCCQQIKKFIERYFGGGKTEYEVFTYASGAEYLKQPKVDILFLDIEMEQINGIQVKDQLQQEHLEVRIIFVTNHRDRMKEAFGKQVYGFLEKPVEFKEVCENLDLVIRDMQEERKILVSGGAGPFNIRISDIFYIKSDGKYSSIICEKEKEPLFSDETIGKWEAELDKEYFYRCQKKYLANLSKVKQIDKRGIMFVNGKIVPVGRKYKKGLEEAYLDCISGKSRRNYE